MAKVVERIEAAPRAREEESEGFGQKPGAAKNHEARGAGLSYQILHQRHKNVGLGKGSRKCEAPRSLKIE